MSIKMTRCEFVHGLTCRQVSERMGELETQNANLREYIERKRDLQDFARLVDENSKLRKLVMDMWREHECCYLAWPNTIADRMRELGVEV